MHEITCIYFVDVMTTKNSIKQKVKYNYK